MITPNGIVRMLNTPLDKNQNNQIRFASRSAQTDYFIELSRHAFSDVTFSRKDSMIKVPGHIDKFWDCNYIMYNNIDQGSRWFYAFIERLEWLSEGSTAVYIKTDVYQTWYLDCTFRKSFVEREHVATDTIGLHTIEEGLETGEYVGNTEESAGGFGTMDIIIATTIKLEDVPNLFSSYTLVGAMYYGVYSGCNFYGTRSAAQASEFIRAYNVMGKLDAIIAVFMAPNIITNANSNSIALLAISATGDPKDVSGPSRPATINGYTPRNNKLLCFPYQFLNVSNNNGSQGIFRFERFSHITNNNYFMAIGGVAPGATYKLLPNYQSNSQNYNSVDEAITLGGFPVCCFSGSAFQTYVSQSVPGAALSLAGTLAGAMTGNVPLAVAGVGSVLAQVGGLAGKAMQPPQLSGNMGSGSANASIGLNDFIIQGKSIKSEYAEIIDEFFDLYGYKVNRVKVPELSSRSYWNYVKTIDANITGPVPQNDLMELRGIFDKGVTLWHSGVNVANYALDNTL